MPLRRFRAPVKQAVLPPRAGSDPLFARRFFSAPRVLRRRHMARLLADGWYSPVFRSFRRRGAVGPVWRENGGSGRSPGAIFASRIVVCSSAAWNR